MRSHCGQKCSSFGAPAPQLRHSSIETERTGIGSGVIGVAGSWQLAAGSRTQGYPAYCRLPAAGCRLSCSKGAPTAAGLLRIRVVEHEPFPQERGVVIERRSLEEQVALAIDEDLRA